LARGSVAILGGQLASAQRLSAIKRKPGRVSVASAGDDADESQVEDDAAGDAAGDNFRIFVRDVDRVAVVGQIDMMCFDKTGTITKSGLDLVGFVPAAAGGGLGGGGRTGDGIVPLMGDGIGGGGGICEKAPLMSLALAVTHTVSRLNTKLIGHQVELRMVEATEQIGGRYAPDMKQVSMPSDEQLRTVKEFSFDHHTMTMSVLAERGAVEGEETAAPRPTLVFVKGSFEAIAARCRGVVPPEWSGAVDMHSSLGCYVISVGYRWVRGLGPRPRLQDWVSLG
jgi:magnesium-transporting ATPase (P-type)